MYNEGLMMGLEFNVNTSETADQIRVIDDCLANVGRQSVKAGRQIDEIPKGFKKSAKELETRLESLDARISKLNKNIGYFANKSKYVIGGLSAGAIFSIKKYADMENAIHKVRNISEKSFESIGNDARTLMKRYGLDIRQILEGNYQLVSSMGDVEESFDILNNAAKLSKVGFTDYESAMNGLVAVMNGYKMQATESGRVTDVLMTIQNKGVTTIGELQATLGRVIPIASSVGVTFEDLGAAMATITSNKIDTANAVTYLNSALMELEKTGTTASKAFYEATGTNLKNYLKAGYTLLDAFQEIEKQAKKTGLSINDMFSSQNAGVAVTNIVGLNTEKMKDSMEAMANATGTANKALSEFDDDFNTRIDKLKAQFEDITMEFGHSLLPQVEKLVSKLEEVNWEEVFSQENIDKTIEIGKQVGTVALAIWGVHKALLAVETVSKGITMGKGFIAWAIKNGGAALAMLKDMGLVAGGSTAAFVGGTAIGAYQLYERDQQNFKENAELKAENEKVANRLMLLRAMQQDVGMGIINPDLFSSVTEMSNSEKEMIKTLESLKIRLDDGENESQILKIANETIEKQIERYREEKIQAQKVVEELSEGIELPETVVNPVVTEITQQESEGIRQLRESYLKAMQDLPKFYDLIGLSEKDKIQNYMSFFRSKLQDAIELGSNELTSKFASKYNEYKRQLNDILYSDIIQKHNSSSSEILKLDSIPEQFRKEIENTRKTIEEIEKLNDDRYKNDIEDLKQHEEYLKDREEQYKNEIQALEEHAQKIRDINNGLSNLSSGLGNLAAVTGSKTIGTASNVFDSFGNIGKAAETVGSVGGLSGLFSSGLGAGLSGLGAIAGGVGAGIGIFKTVGGLFGSGKKKKAKIEKANKENEELYKQQISVMEQLTQAIMQNTERIKSLSDRLLNDIARNPTLKALFGGNTNFQIMSDSLIRGKHFTDITAIEKGRKKYRSGFRKKKKDTFTQVDIKPSQLLKYMGFDNTDIDSFTAEQMRQLDDALVNIGHEDLRRATGKNLTESSLEEWKKQIHIFRTQLDYLEEEKSHLFEGATLESFTGINYTEEKELIKEYTEQFKAMGLEGEHYADVIKEMAQNNRVLVSAMEEVRNATIDSFVSGENGFLNSMTSYFTKIFRNAGSVAYDVLFSEIDGYLNDQFEVISNKLVEIKKSGTLDYSDLFTDFDFNILLQAQAAETQAKKSLDVIKKQLLESGVDISIINQILPLSDFNERLNSLKESLANAMKSGLDTHNYFDFTKTLGESLYNSTKDALVKAFSESSLYQNLIQKFISAEDFQAQLENAGSFEEAFKLSEDIMKKFGYELETAGLGGFDAINKLGESQKVLGNSYYQDQNTGVNINITNNFNREVYGLNDFKKIIRDTTEDGIEEYFNRPKVLC